MRGFPAKLRLRPGLFLALALAGTSLAACADLDAALFGDETSLAADELAAPPPAAAVPPSAGGFAATSPFPCRLRRPPPRPAA